ncbi:hypothetical protein [Spirosoma harenae]
MKLLSYWASRHVGIAISLIILGEIINGFSGVLLGSTLLNQSPLTGLYICILVLIGLIFSIRPHLHQINQSAHYSQVRRWTFLAFSSNFLLFCLLGGIWNQRVQTTHSSTNALGGRRITIVGDSLSRTDSVRLANRSTTKVDNPSAAKESSPRGLYILLGVVGIAVAYVLAGLSCSILCSGYGFLALLTFYLGLGGLAGSIYFFSKAFQRSPKRRRDMTTEERRRDGRRFWLSWLILIGIASVALLVSGGN